MAQEKPFLLNANTVIVYEKGNESLHKNAILLAEYIKESTGLDPAVTTTPRDSNSISLFNLLKSDNPDSYMISVSPEGIVIGGLLRRKFLRHPDFAQVDTGRQQGE